MLQEDSNYNNNKHQQQQQQNEQSENSIKIFSFMKQKWSVLSSNALSKLFLYTSSTIVAINFTFNFQLTPLITVKPFCSPSSIYNICTVLWVMWVCFLPAIHFAGKKKKVKRTNKKTNLKEKK